jgi:hypothetical protein
VFRDNALEQAFAAIAAHRPDADGTCLGCLAAGTRAQPTGPAAGTCIIAREALIVVETHGVRQWDRPVRRSPAI